MLPVPTGGDDRVRLDFGEKEVILWSISGQLRLERATTDALPAD